MALVGNLARQKLAAGELALGFGVHHLRSAATPLIAAATGHDWLFIDCEHGALSIHDATQICLAALPQGITPIVRVCADALDEGTRALDNGALGIVVPHVDTAKQAKRVAEAFHYPPLGHRSWGGSPAAYEYRPPISSEAQRRLNETVLIVAMIESPEAVANADDIAQVAGIDVLLIGTSDLTAEMGISGQIGHKRVEDAYRSVAGACRKHGKYLGMGGVYDEQNAVRYIGIGAQFVLAGSDHQYLNNAAVARTEFLREAPGRRRAAELAAAAPERKKAKKKG
jgi:2-keto-3-deoxy-L-rhamnonate aldolase RhmA